MARAPLMSVTSLISDHRLFLSLRSSPLPSFFPCSRALTVSVSFPLWHTVRWAPEKSDSIPSILRWTQAPGTAPDRWR
jgi:hypothetical protein